MEKMRKKMESIEIIAFLLQRTPSNFRLFTLPNLCSERVHCTNGLKLHKMKKNCENVFFLTQKFITINLFRTSESPNIRRKIWRIGIRIFGDSDVMNKL